MSKIIVIIKAFWKLITNQNARIAKERMTVCLHCQERRSFLILPMNPVAICQVCGCFLKAKTREPDEKCPLNKWKR